MKASQLKPSTWQRARIIAPEERLRKFCGMECCSARSVYVVEKFKSDRYGRVVRRYLCGVCAAMLPEPLRPAPAMP